MGSLKSPRTSFLCMTCVLVVRLPQHMRQTVVLSGFFVFFPQPQQFEASA